MKNNIARLVLFLLCVLDGLLWFQFSFAHGPQPGDYFLDVGQGDSELVILPDGARILIDGGPPNGKAVVELEKLLPIGERYLDLVVLSHPQLDHFGGLGAVLDNFDVGALLWNGRNDSPNVSPWQEFLDEARARGIAMVPLMRGDAIRTEKNVVDVLSPDATLAESAELNDTGLVLLVEAPELRTLFTADIGMNVEDYLLKLESSTLRADVLKAAHHGSKYSSGAAFLRAVNPKVVVIEVGAGNTYGHPGKEALARIVSSTRAQVFRTDQDGTVQVSLVGGTLMAEVGKAP